MLRCRKKMKNRNKTIAKKDSKRNMQNYFKAFAQ